MKKIKQNIQERVNRFLFISLSLLFIVSFNACQEDKLDDVSVINEVNNIENEFDAWLLENYIKPYNIEFVYRLPDIESDMNYTLVPAEYKKSIQMANIVKYLCLDPFSKAAPDGFLQQYFPKMLLLVGSNAHKNNGNIVLGTAEGGLKITLYGINTLNTKNIEQLNHYYFRTIYHEFAHILHQTKDYSTDYKVISSKEYVGDSWDQVWKGGLTEALRAGFISQYSSKEVNEDFVELFSHYVTNTDKQWETKMETAGGKDGTEFPGRAILTQKTNILKDYMMNTWGIDMDKLRVEIEERANKISEQDFDSLK